MATKDKSNLRNWATPLVIGSYLVTGISGIMLFFHLGESLIKEAHEWIGIVFVLGALLHIQTHWVPLKRYLSKPLAQSVIATAMVAASVFVGFSVTESEGGSPVRAVMHSVEQAPLTLVAQLQQRDESELVKLLEKEGYKVTDTTETVQTLANVNSRSTHELIPLLFRK